MLKPFETVAGSLRIEPFGDESFVARQLLNAAEDYNALPTPQLARYEEQIEEYKDNIKALVDIQDEIADDISASEAMPPYCSLTEQEGKWRVVPQPPDPDEVPRFSELPDYILVVNDHGNATLHDSSGREVWSVV